MVEPTKVAGKAAKVDNASTPVEVAEDAPVDEAEVGSDDHPNAASGEDLEREMDRLSLEQAVRDFEIANTRVIDLTQRLISATGRSVELQQELDRTMAAYAELNSHYQAVLGSQAYRLADKLRTIRNLLRR